MTPTDQPSHKASHHHHRPAEELDNEDVAAEHGEIDLSSVVKFAVGLVVVTAVAFLAMGALFRVLDRQAAARDPERSPVALPGGRLPPAPRLLTNEPANLKSHHELEAKTLGSYGWVDQQAGVARIPIDEAKKKVLKDGVPARTAPVKASEGTHAPAMAESSGGRAIK